MAHPHDENNGTAEVLVSARETTVVVCLLGLLLIMGYWNVVLSGESLVYSDNRDPLTADHRVPEEGWEDPNLLPWANFHDPAATWLHHGRVSCTCQRVTWTAGLLGSTAHPPPSTTPTSRSVQSRFQQVRWSSSCRTGLLVFPVGWSSRWQVSRSWLLLHFGGDE